MSQTQTRNLETICASAGVGADKAYGAVSPPLHLSANYAFADPLEKPQYDYCRSGNPTRAQLETALADLEGAASGVIVSSGMAALDLVLCLVEPGDLVLAPHDCYGGTHRLLAARARKGHFDLALVNQTDLFALKAAFAKKPKLVLIETPSNPLLRITDISACVAMAKQAGAITVADNTFLSPRLSLALISSFTRPPSSLMVTAMWSAARFWRARKRWGKNLPGGRTALALPARRLTAL